MLLSVAIMLASFIGMEAFTNVFHRIVMHRLLWSVHRSHHVRTPGHAFEWNDVFVVFFTASAIGLIVLGLPDGPSVWIGTGIACYGITYFVVHDMLIHRRFVRLPRPASRYLLAVQRAHLAHHQHITNEHGEAFGLLWVPRRYWSSSSAHRSPDA